MTRPSRRRTPGGSGRLAARQDARNQPLRDGPALPPKPFPAGPPVLPKRRPSAHTPGRSGRLTAKQNARSPNPSRRAGAPTQPLPGGAAGPTKPSTERTQTPGGSGRLAAKQDARNQPLRDAPALPPKPFPAGPPVLPNRRPSAHKPRRERSPGREAECTEPSPSRRADAPTKTLPGGAAGPTKPSTERTQTLVGAVAWPRSRMHGTNPFATGRRSHQNPSRRGRRSYHWGWPNAHPPPASCSESPAPSLHTPDGCADLPGYSRSRSP